MVQAQAQAQGEESPRGQEEAKKVLRDAEARSAAKSRAVKKQLRARVPPGAQAPRRRRRRALKALPRNPTQGKNADQERQEALELLEAKVNEVKAKGKGGRGAAAAARTNG